MRVYVVINKVNGKLYFGKTSHPVLHRWRVHVYNATWGTPYYFSKAIRRYGHASFIAGELFEVETNERANLLERLLILLFCSSEPAFGYNGTLGGDGVPANEELRRKHSEIKRGARNPMFGRRGVLSPRFGVKHSPETINKLRGRKNPHAGVAKSEATRLKISLAKRGKRLPESTKQKMREAHLRRRLLLQNSGIMEVGDKPDVL